VTSETTRDTIQRLLVGRGRDGSGVLPRSRIVSRTHVAHIRGGIDQLQVRHCSGGTSTLLLKSYERGREKWQGETLDFVWFDEEPPADVYSEGVTRTAATGGMVYLTFTPLLGMSEVVQRFLEEDSPDRHVTRMTIEDARHIPAAERARIVAGYPAHEREARAKGVPLLGSGRVFAVAEEAIAVDAFPIPRHWVQLGGLDFGWDHPTAAVRMAWDREGDVLYVTHAYRQREATAAVNAAALREWGGWLPFAWPHDGLQHSKDSGEQLAAQYRRHGLYLLRGHATFDDGTHGLEAGLLEMLERMQTGRWKVFRHLADWFAEFRVYHRKDGRVVKRDHDLISASRYAMMMRRYADVDGGSWGKKIVYSDKGIV
jgi:phage terminase large subunit-like protein